MATTASGIQKKCTISDPKYTLGIWNFDRIIKPLSQHAWWKNGTT